LGRDGRQGQRGGDDKRGCSHGAFYAVSTLLNGGNFG
jgi:hypothetical protein